MIEEYRFGPFHLSTVLRNNERVVELTPKAFNILRILVQNAPSVVSKERLWNEVWPNVIVTDAAMTVCVTELRKALGDNARKPSYIATVPKRGYRFIADIKKGPVQSANAKIKNNFLVGRAEELRLISQLIARSRSGFLHAVLLSGEAGIGKSALLSSVLADLDERDSSIVIQGQCIDSYGNNEPYSPLLDGLERIARTTENPAFIQILQRHAPSWAKELQSIAPSLSSLKSTRNRLQNPNPRMLRELATFLEALSEVTFVVVSIEDLQWSDPSTLDLLNLITRRRQNQRTIIFATLREPMSQNIDLPQRRSIVELSRLPNVSKLALAPLSVESAEMMVANRFDFLSEDLETLASIAQNAHARTEGNPLFLVNLLDEFEQLKDRLPESASLGDSWRDFSEQSFPASLREIIALQLDELGPDSLEKLVVGAIAGEYFTTALLAAVLDQAEHTVEIRLSELAFRGHLIVLEGPQKLPNGAVTSRYSFSHTLYREHLLERIRGLLSAELHCKVGRYIMTTFANNLDEVANKLVILFEKAEANELAARFRRVAAEIAIRRGEYQSGIQQCQRGIELIMMDGEIDRSEPLDVELDIQLTMGPALISLFGGASDNVRNCYERAVELATLLEDSERRFVSLFGLRSHSLASGHLKDAAYLGETLIGSSKALDNNFVIEANLAAGNTSFQLGKMTLSRNHFVKSISLMEPGRDQFHAHLFGMDPRMFCHSFLAIIEDQLGNPLQAERHSELGLTSSQQTDSRFSRATAENFAAWFYQQRDDYVLTNKHAQSALLIANESDLVAPSALALVRGGWAKVMLGKNTSGLAEIENGLNVWSEIGSILGLPHFYCLYAEALFLEGYTKDAIKMAERALELGSTSGEIWSEPNAFLIKSKALASLDGNTSRALQALGEAEKSAGYQQNKLCLERVAEQRSYFSNN